MRYVVVGTGQHSKLVGALRFMLDRSDEGRPGSGRIRQASVNYLANTHAAGILVGAFDGGKLIGISCSTGFVPCISFTVVQPAYRGRNVGTMLLRIKMRSGYAPEATSVAEDNIASRRMCEKAGLKPVAERPGARGSGTFTIIEYGVAT